MAHELLSSQLESNNVNVSCCRRNFPVGIDFRGHHWIRQYFHNSIFLYPSVWTKYTVESGCLTWIDCFQQGWEAWEQKVTLSVTHCARGLSDTHSHTHTHTHTHAHTYTLSFPNWQWKGCQGKHLIVLLFSVFKLSPLTLMLTDIGLRKGGGGWRVIFKSKEKRDCDWTEHTAYCVSVSEAMEEKTTCVIVTLRNTLEYTSCKCRGLKYTHRGI